MESKHVLYVLIAIAVITGIGYVVTQEDRTPAASTATSESPAASESGATNEPAADTNDTETGSETDTTTPATSEPGVYREYDPQLVAQSEAEHIVLFFHADWCPSCRALEQDILKNGSEIPPDVAIYKVDYDTETELKQRYGITVQHSLVEIDAQGNAEGRVTHPPTLDALLRTL